MYGWHPGVLLLALVLLCGFILWLFRLMGVGGATADGVSPKASLNNIAIIITLIVVAVVLFLWIWGIIASFADAPSPSYRPLFPK